MIKLYFAPKTRSSRPRWMLEELGVPYEMIHIDMSQKDHKKPEYLKIHPHGLVPALQDGDTAMMESIAMCMHLADKFPEKKMAPPLGTPERALYYQWLAYAMTTIEPAAGAHFLHTIRLPEERRDSREVKESKEKMSNILKVLSHALEGREYLVGNSFTTVDLVMASLLNWASMMKMIDDAPVVQAYLARMKERPAFKKSIQA